MLENQTSLTYRRTNAASLIPMAYLNRDRVNQAKTILTTTSRSITSVAMAVGFSDNNYFSRVFRQEVGCSPLAYRREHGV